MISTCLLSLSIARLFSFHISPVQNNEADLVVTGACESPLNAWIIAAFCRLRALCTQFNDNPEKASRPFDSLRKGFVLSEGAATVVLQAWPPPDSFLMESFMETPKPIAEVIGFGRSGKFCSNLLRCVIF